MNTHELHTIADRNARHLGISHGAACALLARAGTAKRRQQAKEKTTTRKNREHPPVYWWNKETYD